MTASTLTPKKHISAQDSAAAFSSKMRTIALVVVALAFVMDLLDSTIVNIAIPSIQSNLGASYAAIQWLVAGYSLAFAILLVTGGRMGDVFGYKKIFMIGVGGFTLASLLSGLAPNPGLLIAARLFQGSMAALMVPQVISLMQVMYKPSERGAINGLFGALGGLAASLGPVVGGLLIKANVFNLDWRPIFLINVPVGIFGLVMAAKYLPDGKSTHPLRLDLRGTAILMVALVLLIFPLIEGRELGWPIWAFLMIIASIPVFVVFALWQIKKERLDGSPLVLPSLFKNRSFTVGLTVNMVFEAAMLGFFLTFGLLLQIGLGFSPIHAAITSLPTAIGIAVTMATLGEKVIPKMGRNALGLGSIVMAIGLSITMLVAHHYGLNVHSWQFILGLVIVGVGMGMIFGALFAAVLNGVDPKHAGSASGILNAAQQVGGAVGIALIGVIFFGQLNHSAAHSFAAIEPAFRQQLSAQHITGAGQDGLVATTRDCFIDRSHEKDSSVVPTSCVHVTPHSPATKQILSTVTSSARQANTTNFNNAFRWSIIYELCLLALTFSLTLFLPRKFKAEAYTEA
ncbi:MAG: drug resistance transporter, EmrB/QacA subfamily [Candidatus Saccharibacteria bacterium]|nr:drug resistance transporter, EmrB/QacA subfamily [Candidatus Saccharibacteria bacterium]